MHKRTGAAGCPLSPGPGYAGPGRLHAPAESRPVPISLPSGPAPGAGLSAGPVGRLGEPPLPPWHGPGRGWMGGPPSEPSKKNRSRHWSNNGSNLNRARRRVQASRGRVDPARPRRAGPPQRRSRSQPRGCAAVTAPSRWQLAQGPSTMHDDGSLSP